MAQARKDKPTDKDKPEQDAADPQAAAQQTTVRWDGSNMQSSYANVCNVSSTREEVTLLFGTNQTWQPANQAELSVQLTNRIILSPYAAKRMSILLNNIITEYESRFGELPIEGA